jgi:hypothetical protein
VKIGIIGAGHIGGNLTRRLTSLGHDVSVANSRGPETLAELAQETGATAVLAQQAPVGADLVVVTVPQKSVPDLPAGLLDGVPVVVDTGNYYPQQRDGKIDEIEAGTPESVWVSQQPGVPVLKAFNGIYFEHLLTKPKPAGDPERWALPIAGDDTEAKAVLTRLLDELGFDAVDYGPLAESWRQQPGTPSYGARVGATQLSELLAQARPERTDDFRA